jgi:hypothetical protein
MVIMVVSKNWRVLIFSRGMNLNIPSYMTPRSSS